MNSDLHEQYRSEIVPEMMKRRGYKNLLEVPQLTKIVLNTGVSADKDRAVLEETCEVLGAVTGQRPVITKARKSISNFKLREGMPVGACVTLRRKMMYAFLYRLVNVTLPRVRDFRGVPGKAFDGCGNYSMGLNDQSVFTEIELDSVKNTVGMNITMVTTANTDDEARELLALLGMPFAKLGKDE
ncbi:MAG: 50S ribosomal protein L5 [Lentisphaerae bacterium]|jgi:large subunit ribosomal protein L5|nr:50S ribosomal protein L5 [Lentisphaerota bacterium]MBT4819152.1 50S ribosomal protein L5 [Lentisphaerota bacterium]MBT5607353.1 50S ribosomal protein L5 [Lentisphaerota bacterium]MBT7058363.1 50S ribosomal protein L5 [Lentisphaerota bacterium]MBT7841680.1 50S ribosomal protein L5 [Lentisphaerota bacterium]